MSIFKLCIDMYDTMVGFTPGWYETSTHNIKSGLFKGVLIRSPLGKNISLMESVGYSDG